MKAVNSEFENDIAIQQWKVLFLLQILADQSSSFARFTVGNLQTLRKDPEKYSQDIYSELKQFHSKYYSSHIMSLTVISNHHPETVSSWIKSSFEGVKQKEFTPGYQSAKFPFPDSYLGKISWMKAVSKENCLYVVIPFEEMYSKSKEKPLEFINSYLSNQGNGSLVALLKDRGLLYNLEPEIIFRSSYATLLEIKFTLTKRGFNNQPLILEYFYAYIRLVEEQGVTAKYYEQLEAIQLINFNFNENRQKIEEEASTLSHNQNYFHTRDLLTCDSLFENFNETILREVLSNITLARSLLIISSNNFVESSEENVTIDSDPSLCIDNTSKEFNSLFTQPNLQTYNTMFKLSYAVNGIPDALIDAVSNFNSSEIAQSFEFHQQNEYLKQDFKILTECADSLDNDNQ